MIFYNQNFTLLNKGFISHDNKCAYLLSYSKFCRENNYSLNVDSLNNNQILIKKKKSCPFKHSSRLNVELPQLTVFLLIYAYHAIMFNNIIKFMIQIKQNMIIGKDLSNFFMKTQKSIFIQINPKILNLPLIK